MWYQCGRLLTGESSGFITLRQTQHPNCQMWQTVCRCSEISIKKRKHLGKWTCLLTALPHTYLCLTCNFAHWSSCNNDLINNLLTLKQETEMNNTQRSARHMLWMFELPCKMCVWVCTVCVSSVEVQVSVGLQYARGMNDYVCEYMSVCWWDGLKETRERIWPEQSGMELRTPTWHGR